MSTDQSISYELLNELIWWMIESVLLTLWFQFVKYEYFLYVDDSKLNVSWTN